MSDNYFRALVVIFCFWTFMTFFSIALDENLSATRIADYKPESSLYFTSGSWLTDLNNWIQGVMNIFPVSRIFIPMFRLMTFQYADVPVLFACFLDGIAVISVAVVYRLLRG